MRIVSLSGGKIALVDNEDYPLVSGYRWYANKGGRTYYPCTWVNRQNVVMHRIIFGPGEWDHINNIGWDNRRSNVRVATGSQQMANRRKTTSPTSSQYKGVSWCRRTRKWQAYITKDYKRYFIGRFDTEEEAARKYDMAALDFFGEYAKTNFSYD